MARFRAVVFDLDHTLFDSERAERFALREALRSLGLGFRRSHLHAYRRINLDVWQQYRAGRLPAGRLSQERFARFVREISAPAPLAGPLSRAYLAAFSRRGELLPGSRRALHRLARRHSLAVVTNGLDRVQRGRLAAARLEALFPVVVTSEACGYAKPDPRILHVALDALGVRGHEALYVGDDLAVDGAAAHAAGVAFCWLDGSPRRRAQPRRALRIATLAELAERLAPRSL